MSATFIVKFPWWQVFRRDKFQVVINTLWDMPEVRNRSAFLPLARITMKRLGLLTFKAKVDYFKPKAMQPA